MLVEVRQVKMFRSSNCITILIAVTGSKVLLYNALLSLELIIAGDEHV